MPTSIFTPATKAEIGDHDINIDFLAATKIVGTETATELRDLTLAIYDFAASITHERGIILADTNDEKTLISSTRPLTIKNKNLSHGLTVDAAQQKLNSCCWHKIGHNYEHFTGTGDYILSENVKDIKIPFDHPSNDRKEKELYSDHMPVIANVELTNLPVTPITSTRPIASAVSNSSKKSRVTTFFNTIIPYMLKSKKKPQIIKYGNAYGSPVQGSTANSV